MSSFFYHGVLVLINPILITIIIIITLNEVSSELFLDKVVEFVFLFQS